MVDMCEGCFGTVFGGEACMCFVLCVSKDGEGHEIKTSPFFLSEMAVKSGNIASKAHLPSTNLTNIAYSVDKVHNCTHS